VLKKQTVKNPQEKAPKGNDKKTHRQVKMIRYNRKSPLSKQQKGGVERSTELSKLVSLLEVDDLSFTFRFGVDSSGLFLFDCIIIH
jgi:hypothetical protein